MSCRKSTTLAHGLERVLVSVGTMRDGATGCRSLMEQNGTIIMTVRRIAAYLGATAGALALALAPTVAHAAFNHIEVGGVAVTSTTFTGTGVAPINATIPGFGTLTCSSATASGTILPTTVTVTSLSVACPAIIPGTTLTVRVNSSGTACPHGIVLTPVASLPLTRMASATNPNGYAGTYDLVKGTANFGILDNGGCVSVVYSVGTLTICSYRLYGTVPWTFDETPLGTAPAISQRLTFGGDLTVVGVSGACPGYSNGLLISLSAALDITTPIAAGATNPGLIDFVP